MRTFVAIDVPTDIRDALGAAQRKLAQTRADVRWVAAENLHVTVKFIGELAESRLGEVLGRLEQAAAQVPVFAVEVEGLDRLPPKGPARTIVSRIVSADQRIMKLHRIIDSALGGMGLPLDMRALLPHLTLGRVSSNHGINRLLRLIEKHELEFFGTFAVDAVTLYQSILGGGPAGGPRYVAAGRANLRPDRAG